MTNDKRSWIALALTVGLALPVAGAAKKSADGSVKGTFYVYADKGARVNHFAPSGWMGDYGDIKIDDGNTEDPSDGKTCIKVSYSAQAKQGTNCAGVYWQQPANNLRDKPAG